MIDIIDLSGQWKYLPDQDEQGGDLGFFKPEFDTSSWKEMQIPTNWYLSDLGDFFGSVWFRTQFDAPIGSTGKDVILKFNAVDYYADVWLNGEYLGSHEGYFAPFEFNVTRFLKATGNVLVVKDNSPRDPTEYIPNHGPGGKSNPLSKPYRGHWAKELTLVKGHHLDAMHRPGSMTKFRGDGNSGGIWQKVELLVCDKVRILKRKVYAKPVWEDGSAVVSVDLVVENRSKVMVEIPATLKIDASNFDSPDVFESQKMIQLQPGCNDVKFIQTIPNVALWNTWDFGKPNLYCAEVTLGQSDKTQIRFGVKEIVHDPKTGWWTMNGKKVFWRGMRYLSSLWISEMTKERYREDLDKMLDLNINSIRIGSHIELDEFYELCDEMGFMVWQVFPYHYCYSDSDDVIERSVPMMKQLVEMLYNHASMGAWSVFKEPEVYGFPDKPNNYGRLCQMLIEAAKTVDPIRWMHSGDYREGVKNITIGQCFDWDFDLRGSLTPIIVEFGCGAFVSKESMLKVLPESELWPPNWDQWEYYNGFYDITFHRAALKIGDSLESFIEDSQVYQARSIKEQIEFSRQAMYSPVGSMYLYYWSEPWPNIGASGLMDYHRVHFKSYDAFKQVYTPVLASFEWEGKYPYVLGKPKRYNIGNLLAGKLWITSDLQDDVSDATLEWKVVCSATSAEYAQGSKKLTVSANSAHVEQHIDWTIPAGLTFGEYALVMTVTDANGKVLSKNDFEFEIVQ